MSANAQATTFLRTETPYAIVARQARALLASGREHYLPAALAEAVMVAPVDGLPAHPTIADYRETAALI